MTDRLEAAVAARADASDALEQVIVEEYRSGLPIRQIALRAGLSRQTVYDILDRHGAR